MSKRPWRIEVRWLRYSTALDENGAYADWSPWKRYRGNFATREAAQRHAADGDLGYYLSFAQRSEFRVYSTEVVRRPATSETRDAP